MEPSSSRWVSSAVAPTEFVAGVSRQLVKELKTAATSALSQLFLVVPRSACCQGGLPSLNLTHVYRALSI